MNIDNKLISEAYKLVVEQQASSAQSGNLGAGFEGNDALNRLMDDFNIDIKNKTKIIEFLISLSSNKTQTPSTNTSASSTPTTTPSATISTTPTVGSTPVRSNSIQSIGTAR